MSYFKKTDAVDLLIKLPSASVGQLVDRAVEQAQPHARSETRFRERVSEMFRTLKATMADALDDGEFEPQGELLPPEDYRKKASGKTFILTCAQGDTRLNDDFWQTLQVIAKDKDAELHVSRFTYGVSGLEDQWFAPDIMPYVSDESLEIAPGLIWSGELNLNPTLVRPVSGFDNYGRGASVIVPHVKVALQSVPTMKDEEARFIYSTGTVTLRNYTERSAGQKASFHHVYGALLVEVDEDGTWYARQLNADSNGNVFDLDVVYTPNGAVRGQETVAVMTHGDIHGSKIDVDACWAAAKLVDRLRPKAQVFHDIIDFMPRNHHNIKDPHFLHAMHVAGTEKVETEYRDTGAIVSEIFGRDFSEHYIVTSNHDQAIEGWLRNTTAFSDPVNMTFWLRLNYISALQREQGRKPRPFMAALSAHLDQDQVWKFIHEDDSLQICGIEHGLHGHLGPSGARGNPKNLRPVGKANTGHTHSCGIVDGVYTAGVFGKLDMGYNKGPSAWSQSGIITYVNGKRAIYTIKNGKACR